MSRTRLLGRGYVNGVGTDAVEVMVHHDVEVVRSRGPRFDEGWSFSDAAGHFHAYNTEQVPFPTLDSESVAMPCDGSCGGVCEGEGYDVTKYSCRICDEEIEPGLIHGEYSISIPGRSSWEAKVRTRDQLPTAGLVSVRLVADDVELFGIARVVGVTVSSDGMTADLVDASELGRHRRTPALAVPG